MIVRVALLFVLLAGLASAAQRRRGFLSKNKYTASSSGSKYADLCSQFSYFTQNVGLLRLILIVKDARMVLFVY